MRWRISIRFSRQHSEPSAVRELDVLELVVIGATLTVAAWAAGAQAHRRSAASRALDRYAQSRGLVFVPPPASPRGASPRVLGSKDNVGYVLDLHRLGGEMRTRISAVAPRGRGPLLSVLQRGAFSSKKEALRIGDEALDRSYVVATGSTEDVEGLREARRALLLLHDRCAGIWLSSDGFKTAVSWRGPESDPVILDAARDTVVMVAGLRRPESPYR